MNQSTSLLNSEKLPFSINSDDGEKFHCEKLLRIREGKRLACSGTFNDQAVFIKLFENSGRGEKHWISEQAGLNALAAANLSSAKLLYSGKSSKANLFILALSLIESAETFQQHWLNSDENQKKSLLQLFLTEIAQHHLANIRHGDPHLNNFLIENAKIVNIDGGEIKQVETMTYADRIKHLALILSQFSSKDENLLFEQLPYYESLAGDLNHNELARELVACRYTRWQNYQKKLFRSCTENIFQQSFFTRYAFKRSKNKQDMQDFMHAPEKWLERHEVNFLKQGNSSTVMSVELDGQKCVIKRYNIKSISHAILRAPGETRAARSWRNSHLLSFHGIASAKAHGFYEHRFGPLKGQAFLILRQLKGRTLRQLDKQEIINCIPQLIALLTHMWSQNIIHGDLKDSNFIIQDEQISLIDVDAMQSDLSSEKFRQLRQQDVARFLKNWQATPEITAILKQALEDSSYPVQVL